MKKSIVLIIAIFTFHFVQINAQNESSNQPIVLEALFELPVVPDEITDITQRSNYFVEHFWDPFNFNQNAVGQVQLNHAFSEYVVGLRFSDRTIALKSVDKLISKLNKNATLLYQFTRAAEENLYSENAEVWIDDVYLEFLEAVIKHKKIKDIRKARYVAQYEGRSGNGQILYVLKEYIKKFEELNGKIEIKN